MMLTVRKATPTVSIMPDCNYIARLAPMTMPSRWHTSSLLAPRVPRAEAVVS